MAKKGVATPWAPPPRRLSALRPATINVFPAESQPLQEGLVRFGVTALEELMPTVSPAFVQADFLKHGDPFFHSYMVFHISIRVTVSLSVQPCKGHDEGEAKV
jgi:hypothetical protein